MLAAGRPWSRSRRRVIADAMTVVTVVTVVTVEVAAVAASWLERENSGEEGSLNDLR